MKTRNGVIANFMLGGRFAMAYIAKINGARARRR
jgi:hypothetical protein